LDEDDLDLMDENVGRTSSSRLTRLRRGSSPTERRSRRVSDEEEDEDDLELPQVQDIQRIWDDDRGGREDEDDADRDDMDDFIEYEDEDEDQQQMNEQERRQKRQEAKQRMRANVVRGAIPGIDAKYVHESELNSGLILMLILSSAWDEIHEVFGDGHEYDWALEGEDDVRKDEEVAKPELKYQDVRS
jgi:transcription elongation factor SPT6